LSFSLKVEGSIGKETKKMEKEESSDIPIEGLAMWKKDGEVQRKNWEESTLILEFIRNTATLSTIADTESKPSKRNHISTGTKARMDQHNTTHLPPFPSQAHSRTVPWNDPTTGYSK
jgi:hypothetical protein